MQLYTVYVFLENCSTCFGWYLHPSSGAHNCIYSIRYLLTVRDKNKLCKVASRWKYIKTNISSPYMLFRCSDQGE